MYVCVRGGPNQPLHRDLQWPIVLYWEYVVFWVLICSDTFYPSKHTSDCIVT
jgi:hypothetical protein